MDVWRCRQYFSLWYVYKHAFAFPKLISWCLVSSFVFFIAAWDVLWSIEDTSLHLWCTCSAYLKCDWSSFCNKQLISICLKETRNQGYLQLEHGGKDSQRKWLKITFRPKNFQSNITIINIWVFLGPSPNPWEPALHTTTCLIFIYLFIIWLVSGSVAQAYIPREKQRKKGMLYMLTHDIICITVVNTYSNQRLCLVRPWKPPSRN